MDKFHKSLAHNAESGNEKVYVLHRRLVKELVVYVIDGI